jgi:hypothetical protein
VHENLITLIGQLDADANCKKIYNKLRATEILEIVVCSAFPKSPEIHLIRVLRLHPLIKDAFDKKLNCQIK